MRNPYEGNFKRVLCVCTAGMLRSPTAAEVLSQAPYNFNTRSCGAEPAYALIPLSPTLVAWADEIVCMSPHHKKAVDIEIEKMGFLATDKTVLVLDVPDEYERRDPKLVEAIVEAYNRESAKLSSESES